MQSSSKCQKNFVGLQGLLLCDCYCNAGWTEQPLGLRPQQFQLQPLLIFFGNREVRARNGEWFQYLALAFDATKLGLVLSDLSYILK
jgi:hypothetical protein